MKLEIIVPQTVDFHNQSLVTLQKDGIAYVAMKPICENIGLDWDAQRQRIKRDEVLNSHLTALILHQFAKIIKFGLLLPNLQRINF